MIKDDEREIEIEAIALKLTTAIAQCMALLVQLAEIDARRAVQITELILAEIAQIESN